MLTLTKTDPDTRDAHLMLERTKRGLLVDCRWPLDRDTDEWFTLASEFRADWTALRDDPSEVHRTLDDGIGHQAKITINNDSVGVELSRLGPLPTSLYLRDICNVSEWVAFVQSEI